MQVYVTVGIDNVEEDADIVNLAAAVTTAVKQKFCFNEVTLQEVEVH